MFMFVPTLRYPEYWLTPLVVSQIPELFTNSILAPVAACSKTLYTTPSRSTKDRLSCLKDGAAVARPVRMAAEARRDARIDRMMED